MTDQEALAQLIHDPSTGTFYGDNAHDAACGYCHNLLKHKHEYGACSYSKEPSYYRPKPIHELIELAEELFLNASWTKKVGKASESKPYYYVEWNLPVFPHKIVFTGDTKMEARIRCAIPTLKRLNEERKRQRKGLRTDPEE